MELTCPHCNKQGVSKLFKFIAIQVNSATCNICGEQSVIKGLKLIMVLIMAFILMMACFMANVYLYRTLYFIYVSAIIPFLIPIAVYFFVPLVAIKKRS